MNTEKNCMNCNCAVRMTKFEGNVAVQVISCMKLNSIVDDKYEVKLDCFED